MEIWKDIKDYENKYQISNLGKVRNIKTKKLYITSIDSRGYYRINLYDNLGKYKTFRVHRLLGVAFIPNTNNYPCINHIDGNKANNELSNLEWCTYQQNTIHAFETGLKFGYKGEKHGMCKLTNDQVLAIRADNRLHRIIAKEYNVDRSTIGYIKSKKLWNHI